MSSEAVITAHELTKVYQIYRQPIDRLKQAISRGRKRYYQPFRALDRLSFDVIRGETVGVVGRNGAGKSTLLQLMCGTLAPTSGHIEIHGRIAALLELGAGFNPQFTGRENVYLNGSILGLSRKEIDRKYHEIVEFADIGEFIDRPVKTYSSGMFLRLAFAVAINVEPDILIVDEALSVGDMSFRNKCYDRIRAMKERGVTIFFVSHNLNVVQMLCDRVMWLEGGKLVEFGDAVDVCQRYQLQLSGVKGSASISSSLGIPQHDTGFGRFVRLEVGATEHAPFRPGDDIEFRFSLQALTDLGKMYFSFSIFDQDGARLVSHTSKEHGVFWPPATAGSLVKGRLVLKSNILGPGRYLVAFAARSEDSLICYAQTQLAPMLNIQSDVQVWGKVVAPCEWRSE